MRKALLMALVLVVVALILFAGISVAAGPEPGTGPWVIVDADEDGFADFCWTWSGAPGHLLLNTNSGNEHCFKD